jgi:tetratricopeptide (TPR) repeat protein
MIDRAERLHEEHHFTEARTVLLSALEDASKHQKPEYRLAYTFNNLGAVAQDAGRYFEAEKYYRESISYWQGAGERARLGLARTLNNLATLLDSGGKLAEAQELLRRSEAILIERRGLYDPAISVVLLNRGNAYFKQRRYTEAEKAYRHAWAVLEPHRESRELEIARLANDLGLVCEKTGRKGEAQLQYSLARGIWEKQLRSGKATPEIFMDLGGLYSILRQDLLAKRVLQQGLVVAERELGLRHPRVADMLFLYARVLRQTGSRAEAARIAKQAKAIQRDSQEHLARHTIAFADLLREERRK